MSRKEIVMWLMDNAQGLEALGDSVQSRCDAGQWGKTVQARKDLVRPVRGAFLRVGLLGLVVATALASALPVRAALLTQSLEFVAPEQSLWGPGGGAASFGSKGSVDAGIATFGYDIGASSGTVSALFRGDISVGYVPYLAAPGTTTFNLGFLGDLGGGQLKSDLGAWAKVNVSSFDVLNEGYSLNIDKGYTPKLGQTVSGSAAATVGNAGVDVVVAKAGADFDIEQTDSFKVTALSGLLAYSLQGSGSTSYKPFSIATAAGLTMDLGLDKLGIWDVWLADMMLENEFSTAFDAEMVLYEEHVAGIKTCRRCVWGVCVPIPCGIDYDRNEFVLADLDVYNASPFSLAFNGVPNASSFSVQVGTTQVPEPTTLVLVGAGLLGVAVTRRRSPAATAS